MAQGTASTRLRSGIPSEAASGAPAADGSRRWTTSLASFDLLWVAVALFAVGVLLRVSGITTQSLWTDDGFSLDYSSCDNLTACFKNITSGHSSEQFNILYFFILHLWRVEFGESTLSLRSLSVAISILALPLIWSTAASLFDRSSAAWSLAFTAVSAFSIYYAHEIRSYAFLMLVSSLQIWLLARARGDGAGGYWRLLLAAASFIASWSSIFCLLFTAAIAIGDLLARREWMRGLKWWMPSAVACLPAVLYYLLRVVDSPPDSVVLQKSDTLYLNALFVLYGHLVGLTYSVPLVALRGADRWMMVAQHWRELAVFVVISTLLAWQIVGGLRGGGWTGHRQYGVRLIVFSTAVYTCLCLLLAFTADQNWLPRHAFALHIFLALLLPAAAASPHVSHRVNRLRLISLLGLLVLNLWSLKNYYYEPAHWRDDYRGVASYLKEQWKQGRPAVMLLGKVSILRHYGDQFTVDGGSFDRSLMPLEIRAATDNAKEVLIVVNREYALESEDGYVRGWEPRGLVVSMMSSHYKLLEKMTFHYFTVYRFSLQTADAV